MSNDENVFCAIMIQCFEDGCNKHLSQDALQCDECKFFTCCSRECLAKHASRGCQEFRQSVAHRSVAKMIERVLHFDWTTVVEKTMGEKIMDINSCWTCVFALARTVGGHPSVEEFARNRVKDEIALCVPAWNAAGTFFARDSSVEKLNRLAKGEDNDFEITVGKILPGENYFINSPHLKETCSYDHAFALVPMERTSVAGNRRALLIQATKKTKFTATIIDRKQFWNDLGRFIETRVWTDETTTLFRNLFVGVKLNYPGRTLIPIFKAEPLLAATCVVCNRQTMPLHCAQCKKTIYCTKECQKHHWQSSHKEECRLTHVVYG